jgi:hypothetical protein
MGMTEILSLDCTRDELLYSTYANTTLTSSSTRLHPNVIKVKLLSFYNTELFSDVLQGAEKLMSLFNRCKSQQRSPTACSSVELNVFVRLIGRTFFKGMLEDVQFSWSDKGRKGGFGLSHYDFPRLMGDNRFETTTDRCRIFINRESYIWEEIPDSQIWEAWLGILLHEAVHIVFAKFAYTLDSVKGGHHAAWQIIAFAVERLVLKLLPGIHVDLGRATSLCVEHRRNGELDLDRAEVEHCFGDVFDYRPPQSGQASALYNDRPITRWGLVMVAAHPPPP